ncbi:MAG: hypothetical protein RDU14_04690 [Melioribacteraceae bacterium]|nr:hypothetical protein [Melioribacteraceae bacterium]
MIGYNKIGGMVLTLFGLLISLAGFNVIKMGNDEIIGTVLILQAIPSVFLSLMRNRKDLLFLFTVIFMIGIIFIIKSHFEIIESRGLIFSSILLISGSGFLILYIDNLKEQIFLYTGMLFFALGYFSITFLRELGVIGFANSLANIAEDFWPIVLILSGLTIFINRRK